MKDCDIDGIEFRVQMCNFRYINSWIFDDSIKSIKWSSKAPLTNGVGKNGQSLEKGEL